MRRLICNISLALPATPARYDLTHQLRSIFARSSLLEEWRFLQEELNWINELIAERGKDQVKEAFASVQNKNNPDDPDDDSGSQLLLNVFVKPADWPEDKNWGTLTIDASCVSRYYVSS